MHCLHHVLRTTFTHAVSLCVDPRGPGQRKGDVECVITARLRALHCPFAVSKWNVTQCRAIFAHWQELFDGVLPQRLHYLVHLASHLSFLLYSSSIRMTEQRCAALITSVFLLGVQCDVDHPSLWWHGLLRHLVSLLRTFGLSAVYFCEELFEATFRPVKRYFRNRSNHRLGRDLQVLRAIENATAHVHDEYGGDTRNKGVWPVSVGLDVIICPCLLQKDVIVANLSGFLDCVAQLSPTLCTTAQVDGVGCLRVRCGDVDDFVLACECEHKHVVDHDSHDQWIPEEGAAQVARTSLLGSDEPDHYAQDCDSDYCESPDSDTSSNQSSLEADQSPSEWSPRSYYDQSQEGSSSTPIAHRTRRRLNPEVEDLGIFFSEQPAEEQEYSLSDCD